MTESWLPVAGFEGRYEVSDHGLVRSVARGVRRVGRGGAESTRHIKSRVIKTHTWGAKYPGVVLVSAEGKRSREMVHRLVARAFVANPFGHAQVNHLDADTRNAVASNLEWCDQSQNVKHAYRIGTRRDGKDHHFSTLPRDESGRCLARANRFKSDATAHEHELIAAYIRNGGGE